jgi:hypothetical protein
MTGMTDKGLYIEETLLNSVKNLLFGRVNELLGETEFAIPSIEFKQFPSGAYIVTPVLGLTACEQTEKERIVRLEVYSLTITFAIPESTDSERNGYAYAGAVAVALKEDPTLGGVVDRAELTGKKYVPPKHQGTGGDWEVILTFRVTVEGGGYAG